MNYQLSVIPKFPARVVGGPGIAINKANGVYTFTATGPGSGLNSVRAFGAVGDGVTDDSAAFQTAFDTVAAMTNNCALYIPAGRYLLASQVIFTMQDRLYESGLAIYGDGSMVSTIVAAKTNSVGCFKIITNDVQQVVRVSGLGFVSSLTTADAGLHNGVALWVTSTVTALDAGFGDHNSFGAVIDDVAVLGDGANPGIVGTASKWSTCIAVHNTWYPLLTRVRVRSQDFATSQYGIDFLDCYDPRVVDSTVHGSFAIGIYLHTVRPAGYGNSFEGGRVQDCVLVGMRTGVKIEHTTVPNLNEPGFNLTDCHINTFNYGLWVYYHMQITVTGNYFYCPAFANATVALPACLYIERGSDIGIVNNQFLSVGFYNSDSNCTTGVYIGPFSAGVNIDANIFNMSGIGIYNAADPVNVSRNLVGVNQFSLGQRPTPPYQTFTRILDTTNTLRMSHDARIVPSATSVTLTNADSGGVFTNANATGMVTFTLPPAVAGLEFSFINVDLDGLTIKASGSDVFRLDEFTSVVAGTLSATTIAAAIRIKCTDVLNWIAVASTSNFWSMDGTPLYSNRVRQSATDLTVTTTMLGWAFTNAGAGALVTFTLPAAQRGLRYRFTSVSTLGLKVLATGSNRINLNGVLSAVNGNLTTVAALASVTLEAVDTTSWAAVSSNNIAAWTVT